MTAFDTAWDLLKDYLVEAKERYMMAWDYFLDHYDWQTENPPINAAQMSLMIHGMSEEELISHLQNTSRPASTFHSSDLNMQLSIQLAEEASQILETLQMGDFIP